MLAKGFRHRHFILGDRQDPANDALNGGILPSEYYALPQQQAAGFGPDILTLQTQTDDRHDEPDAASSGTPVSVLARPQTQFTAETDREFYRRKKSST